MKIILGLFLLITALSTRAQNDSASNVVVHKDPRIDLLIKKQIDINEETTRDTRRTMQGYRILVINSNDRNKVFAAKAKIYQLYPDLKPYLMYQPPFYKLKVGNFKTKEEAEEYRKELLRQFPTGLYVIREIIEVKPGTGTN
ncbi:MAG TPA: SPOR domain-containing protein [Chitinophagaceae bacterium]|nr:SPOR domain-containing protein [Chitinophagaceae bacterium]